MKLRNIAVAAASATLLSVAAPAVASPNPEPYGGCGEAWQAPKSSGASHCRHLGWTVRPHFVIDPHHRLIATDFGPCKYEDSNGCYWDAHRRGNGRGTSFVTSKRGEVFYVAAWNR